MTCMVDKPERSKGLYERLLEEKEGSRAEVPGPSPGPPESFVLTALEEKAAPPGPGYTRDLYSLHRLMRDGGPKNWVSSAWFHCLKKLYPSEYEKLKAEHLSQGKHLQEGFIHGRAFARGEFGGLNIDEDLMFCSSPYESFWHEADVLLLAAAREVEAGTLSPEEARRLLEPYRGVLPLLYGEVQKVIFDPARSDWSKEGSFPRADEVRRNPPASAIFWYKADGLGIPGVGLTWATPHPIFEVSPRALRELRRAVAGEYTIVRKNSRGTYSGDSLSLSRAITLLDREVGRPG